VTSSTPIEDQIRERLARIIGALRPIAESGGPFSDVRDVQIVLTSLKGRRSSHRG
jgi:enamine deaminase RidA (YjgF/YER057c/UK114 family)